MERDVCATDTCGKMKRVENEESVHDLLYDSEVHASECVQCTKERRLRVFLPGCTFCVPVCNREADRKRERLSTAKSTSLQLKAVFLLY